MRSITRSQAIEDLREVLLRMVDGQNSLCRVAGWRKLFCRGFSQWGEAELEQRFRGLPRRSDGLERGHLERLANERQLHHQDIRARRLPCDNDAACTTAPCLGWSEFSDQDLARFHREICGEKVRVVPDARPGI